jgi:hypothetical protein
MDKIKKGLKLKFKGKDKTVQRRTRQHKGDKETFHSLVHTKQK